MSMLVVMVHTAAGTEHKVQIDLGSGADSKVWELLPQALARGVWLNNATFIPGHAIVRADIVSGPLARFRD
jgi:hypothetical protein